MFFLLQGYTINLSSTYFVWGIVVLVVVAVILLWYGIPQKLAKGWESISKLQDKNELILNHKIEELGKDLLNKTEALADLTREVDIRREINRQDTIKISSQKDELAKNDETISSLRSEIRNLELRLKGN